MLHAVVMAGGSGTRFWPQSRKSMPKQLLKLAGDRTMIQQTVDRCESWIDAENIWVVTNADQVEETRRQLPELPAQNVLVEPCGRNTAPCIGLAAVHMLRRDPDAVMFVMPADHVIQPAAKFQSAGRCAVDLVEADPTLFALFGIPPAFPSTGYGYIERGAELTTGSHSVFAVKSFREKPDRETAQQYIDSGDYYWNCGIFSWSAQTILDALRQHVPNTHERLLRIQSAIGSSEETTVLESEFPEMDSISIDYAVLERAANVAVVEAPFEWDDVGSWLALPRLLATDDDGNTIDGEWCGVESKNCIVRTTHDHLIATLGMQDCIIVHTPDATLIANRNDADSMRKLVDALRASGHEHLL